VEPKLHPPLARPGIVPRTALVERLLASDAEPVVCVIAPAGYGKTTLLAQWAQHTAHRVGWVSVDQRDNDPAVLLRYLAVALDRVEPIDPEVMRGLTAPGASIMGAVPRLAAAVTAMTQPVALVLDHVELLDNQQCLDAVAELAAQIPKGAQLLLASRTRPPLPVSVLRAQGQVVEVGADELAMDHQEAAALLEGAGVQLDDAEVDELIERTEGWPVGLYLTARALRSGRLQAGGPRFTGDDPFMADYLRSELLGHLPPEQVAFLTRTAVLDRMCGPLCDAVLDTTGSSDALAALEESNLLLVPLDRRRQWYRYHHLFQELLTGDRDRLRSGRGGCRSGCPAGLEHGPARLRRRTGRHRPPLVRLVRGPGAARALPAGGPARGLAAGPGRAAGSRRALGRCGRPGAGCGDAAGRQHHAKLPGAAARAVVPQRPGPDASRRAGRPG
jgi:LuxR family maltose regulon positive regulatory protein